MIPLFDLYHIKKGFYQKLLPVLLSAELYFNIYWKCHIKSFSELGIGAEKVHLSSQTSDTSSRKVIAVVKCPDRSNPIELDKRYMVSQDFKDNMTGFPMEEILNVKSIF